MDWVLLGKLVAIVLLVVGNAFFVGSEIALTSARRSRIKQLAGMGNKSAKIVQLLHNEPERFYSVTQIGITLVSLALGAIGMITIAQIIDPGFEKFFSHFGQSEELTRWAHTLSYAVAFLFISFLHVVGGELAPKVLAFHKAEPMSLSVAWTINALHTILKPLIWVMNRASNGLLWLFGQRDLTAQGEGHFSMTGDEIRTILSASEQEGVMDPQLTMMLRGVFDLDEHTARDAMVPRTELLALPITATVKSALKLFKDVRRARYPVFDGSPDNIVGVVAMKELLNHLGKDDQSVVEKPVTEIMLPPYFVPDTMQLSRLLKDFTSNRRQLAIVLDEYGGTAGLITLEDILEEIVGEYEDEFSPRHRHIKKEDRSHFIINGGVRVTELEPKLNFPFPTGDYVTLGGLVYNRLGRIPEIGDVVDLEGGRLEVLEMDNHRVTSVMFQDLGAAEGGEIHLPDDELNRNGSAPDQSAGEKQADMKQAGVKEAEAEQAEAEHAEAKPPPEKDTVATA